MTTPPPAEARASKISRLGLSGLRKREKPSTAPLKHAFHAPAMRLKNPGLVFLFAAGIFFGNLGQSEATEIGTERLFVIHELGRPTYSVARGETEVFTYPHGVRITLTNGRVSGIVGLKPAPFQPAGSDSADGTAPEPSHTSIQVEKSVATVEGELAARSQAQAKMEKAIEDIENEPAHRVVQAPPKFDLKKALIGFALRCLLTLAALKLTCKYWGAEIFLSGLITVALVDASLRGIAGAVATAWLHTPSLFYADEALAAVAMVLILRKVSINQSMAQAVQITMTTKTFSVVVGSMLVTFLLHAIA